MEGRTLVELATLVAIVRLEDNAYARAIRDEIESFRGQSVPLASVHAALQRLTRRRWLEVTRSRPIPVQGGRARPLYRLTSCGESELQHEHLEYTHLWQALPRRFLRPTVRG